MMHLHQDTHTEAALYWSAVSLIVCEGLSIGAAAERLGIETVRLRNILRRRRRRLAARLHDHSTARRVSLIHDTQLRPSREP